MGEWIAIAAVLVSLSAIVGYSALWLWVYWKDRPEAETRRAWAMSVTGVALAAAFGISALAAKRMGRKTPQTIFFSSWSFASCLASSGSPGFQHTMMVKKKKNNEEVFMNDLTVRMLIAGVLFGCWPLLMNRSGLTGTTSAVAFSALCLLSMLPVAVKNGMVMAGANWWFAIAAGVCGGIGLLIFTNGLTKATPATVGRLFIIMLVVQTAVPAVYHAIMNGGITMRVGAGFAAALVAAILLV